MNIIEIEIDNYYITTIKYEPKIVIKRSIIYIKIT